MDRLEALLRGGAQGATGGWGDEVSAALLQLASRFQDDKTGIPREYAGGQYEQYRDQARADNAEAQRKYPKNYLAGNLGGSALQGVALSPLAALGVPGAVGLGALEGAGFSDREGVELAKDAALGGVTGGTIASIPQLVKAVKAVSPEVRTALAGLGGSVAPEIRALATQGPPMPHVNMTKGGGSKVVHEPASELDWSEIRPSSSPPAKKTSSAPPAGIERVKKPAPAQRGRPTVPAPAPEPSAPTAPPPRPSSAPTMHPSNAETVRAPDNAPSKRPTQGLTMAASDDGNSALLYRSDAPAGFKNPRDKRTVTEIAREKAETEAGGELEKLAAMQRLKEVESPEQIIENRINEFKGQVRGDQNRAELRREFKDKNTKPKEHIPARVADRPPKSFESVVITKIPKLPEARFRGVEVQPGEAIEGELNSIPKRLWVDEGGDSELVDDMFKRLINK